MVQNVAEGKEEVRSVNEEQQCCSHTELLIVGNSDKLVCLLLGLQHSTALSFNTSVYCSLMEKTLTYTGIPEIFRNFSKELYTFVSRFLNLNVT